MGSQMTEQTGKVKNKLDEKYYMTAGHELYKSSIGVTDKLGFVMEDGLGN